MMRYNWNNEVIMFQGLIVPKLEEREGIVNVIHVEISHFSEYKMPTKVKKISTSSMIGLNL